MKLGVYQADAALTDWQQRRDALEQALQAHASDGLDLVLCPELFVSGYANAADVRTMTTPADGPMVDELKQMALRHQTALCIGYPEQDGDLRYNSVCYLSSSGELLANHRKQVLPTRYEDELFDQGQGFTIFDSPDGWRIGLLICYEVEFPEAVRACARADAQLVLVPTALGMDWAVVSRQLVPSRAFENNVFLAYANFAGSDGEAAYIGDSVIVSPWGVDLARAGQVPGMIIATLDAGQIDTARKRLPYLADLPRLTTDA